VVDAAKAWIDHLLLPGEFVISVFTSTNSGWFFAGNLQGHENRAHHWPNIDTTMPRIESALVMISAFSEPT
jgi:hypothetical protein